MTSPCAGPDLLSLRSIFLPLWDRTLYVTYSGFPYELIDRCLKPLGILKWDWRVRTGETARCFCHLPLCRTWCLHEWWDLLRPRVPSVSLCPLERSAILPCAPGPGSWQHNFVPLPSKARTVVDFSCCWSRAALLSLWLLSPVQISCTTFPIRMVHVFLVRPWLVQPTPPTYQVDSTLIENRDYAYGFQISLWKIMYLVSTRHVYWIHYFEHMD